MILKKENWSIKRVKIKIRIIPVVEMADKAWFNEAKDSDVSSFFFFKKIDKYFSLLSIIFFNLLYKLSQ